jgi:hypothetical protein
VQESRWASTASLSPRAREAGTLHSGVAPWLCSCLLLVAPLIFSLSVAYQAKAKQFEGKSVKATGVLDVAKQMVHVTDIQLV